MSKSSFTSNPLGACLLFIAIALVSSYAQIWPYEHEGDRFIGHGDQAQVAMVARNFAEGRGMTADTVWLLHNGGRAGNEISHPEGYWSIYVAAILAGFFTLFGANHVAVLLAASLLKIGIAALGFYWIRRLSNDYFAATVGGIILLVHPIMADRVSALSDIYLTFFILGTITALLWAADNGGRRFSFLVGVFAGLAIGMKPSGLILLGIIPVWIFLGRGSLPSWKESGLGLLGLLLAVTPLAIHNLHAGGSIWWPDHPLLQSAGHAAFLLRGEWRGWASFESVAAWNASVYDPTSRAVHLSFGSWDWIRLHATNFRSFYRVLIAGDIAPLWLLPFVFHVSAKQLLDYRKSPIGYKGQLNQFTVVTILLCGSGLVLAAIVHAEARYWNYLIPFLVVTGIVGAAKFSRASVVFILIWCSLLGVSYHSDVRIRVTKLAAYQFLDQLIPKDAVVMTSNPWEFSFHTRRKSVVLPYTSDPTVVTELAKRYGVDYLVVIQRDARHASFDRLEQGAFPPYLKKVHYSRGLVVGAFKGQPKSASKH